MIFWIKTFEKGKVGEEEERYIFRYIPSMVAGEGGGPKHTLHFIILLPVRFNTFGEEIYREVFQVLSTVV